MARGKEQRKTMTAIARELLGFIWAIGIKAEALPANNKWRHDEKRKNKTKNSPNKEKAKTHQPMNDVIQLEDRVSRSRSKHEGESSAEVCDRLSRTRVYSQRQLPTDHDYAVPTREYQLDQSSPLPASAAADLVLGVQRQKQPQRFADIDRSHHINFRVAHVYVSPSQEKSTEFLGAHRRARNWSDQDPPLRNSASRPMIPASSRTTHPFAV